MSGPRGWVLFAILLLLSIALRLFSLDSDPPRPITGGPSPNEGLYVANARNEVVEGHWKLDDWNSTVIQPLGSALTAFVFRYAGTGLKQARLLSVVLSLCALVLFFVLMREASGPTTALLGALLLGTNGIFLTYSRQAGPAPLSILLMLSTILLWRLGKRRVIFATLAGIMLVLAGIVEDGSHNLFFVATAGLATLMVRLQAWKMPWATAVRRRVRAFWWAALMTMVVWVVVFVVPNREEFTRMLKTPVSNAQWGNVAANLFMAPFNFGALLQWSPLICIVSFVYLLIFARSLMAPIARHRPISETRAWLFAWLITGPLITAARSDRRLPVLVLLVPALCAAAAEALSFLLTVRRVRKPHVDILVVIGLLALFTWILVQLLVHTGVLMGYGWIPRAFYRHQNRYEFVVVLALAVPITWFLAHMWLRWKKFTFDMSPRLVSGLFAFLLVAMLLTSTLVARSIFRAGHDVAVANAGLAELPRGSVVAGTWAPLASIDTGHRALVIWSGVNGGPDAIERYGVTHLLLQRGSGEDLHANPVFRNDARAKQAVWIRSMRMGRFDLDLYALQPPSPLTGRSALRERP